MKTKKFAVVMLATDKSELYLADNILIKTSIPLSKNKEHNLVPQHLYFISDEEIKEGDHILCMYGNTIDTWSIHTDYQMASGHECCKKIIASTDKSLKLSTTDDIYEGFLKSIPQIPESFIKAYIKAYNEGNVIKEVELEMKTVRDVSMPDEALHYRGGWRDIITTNSSNEVQIIHSSKDSYTREEVTNLLFKFASENIVFGREIMHSSEEYSLDDIKDYIEDNL